MTSPGTTWLAVLTAPLPGRLERVALERVGAFEVLIERVDCAWRLLSLERLDFERCWASAVAWISKHIANATEAIVLFTVAAPSLAKLASKRLHPDCKVKAAKLTQPI